MEAGVFRRGRLIVDKRLFIISVPNRLGHIFTIVNVYSLKLTPDAAQLAVAAEHVRLGLLYHPLALRAAGAARNAARRPKIEFEKPLRTRISTSGLHWGERAARSGSKG
jgi:hypothetical protein